jgi:hypothetical protein
MARLLLLLTPAAVVAVVGFLVARGLSRASRRRRALEGLVARHREMLSRSARWIREGRMRAVLSDRGATSWYLTVAAHHLQLADEAEVSAEISGAEELAFLAEQHRLMHHLFMSAPMQTAHPPAGPARTGMRA